MMRITRGDGGRLKASFPGHLSNRDEQSLETHINYIHYNPVKHGWVTRAVARFLVG